MMATRRCAISWLVRPPGSHDGLWERRLVVNGRVRDNSSSTPVWNGLEFLWRIGDSANCFTSCCGHWPVGARRWYSSESCRGLWLRFILLITYWAVVLGHPGSFAEALQPHFYFFFGRLSHMAACDRSFTRLRTVAYESFCHVCTFIRLTVGHNALILRGLYSKNF